MDGQTKVVNRSICNILILVVRGIIRQKALQMPQAEFAYSRPQRKTTSKSSFKGGIWT